ncbi:GyrI-like domain-containing protein [Clostridium sp. 'deep sea']|uniref:GyrI-like domain-containing protein n=1 Tax=Clostridium sp. 'deep sea' TaxID=2779445 RepID=UPI00189671E4|nr:GyrI-like domain-containing protein [Clostridium sp. 'deep sea']QOR35301.1 GyrI-like domain-containing protein [Clostridium sp. 'deep sea']
MKIRTEKKNAFTVVGKLGKGYASNSKEWIPQLWKDATANFHEIKHLALTDEQGNYKIWGAMSDINTEFKRWGEQGLYMVGCEAQENAIAPDKWVKWTIPSFTYLIVECDISKSVEVFNNILNNYFPENNLTLVGAVHEFYPAYLGKDKLELYFPIEKP